MKYLMFYIILILLPYYSISSIPPTCREQHLEKQRIENRKSNDPIYETGDTLYLFYDCTDSLQIYYQPGSSKIMLWKIREMTQAEKEEPDPPEYDGLFSSEKWVEFYLFNVLSRKKTKILTFGDLKGIVLTSRKEFLDFYQREYVRKKGKFKDWTGMESLMELSEYNFHAHFAVIYMLIPRSDNTFELYSVNDIPY